MKESVKELIAQNKNLFIEDNQIFSVMMDLAEDCDCDDERIELIIKKYIENRQHQYEHMNVNVLYDYVSQDEEALTLQQLDKECSRSNRYHHKLSLVLTQINLSHPVETIDYDQVLLTVENSLRQSLRRTDCVGKYKKDKILILLPNTSIEESLVVIEKLKQTMISVGVANNWHIREGFSLTEFVRWEDYELLLKRLEHGIIKGTQSKRHVVQL